METPSENKIYFQIFYQTKEKEKEEDLSFLDTNKILPVCIYTKEKQESNGKYSYEKVIQVGVTPKNNENPKKVITHVFEFEKDENNYVISFDRKANKFIYDVVLKMGKNTLKKTKRTIPQNIIDYYKKFELFREALIKNKEKNKLEELYKETIDLYSRKKGFSFFISLFVDIYQNKDLCPLLMNKFKEINDNPVKNEKNMDRNQSLELYQSIFREIASGADELIKKNDYDVVKFYGIILCYLNYYDKDTFSDYEKKLSINNQNVLFEILITFNSHFKNPINENLDFFIKLINYAASEKNYVIFKNGLRYIKDIETLLIVLQKNIEIIFEKYVKSQNNDFLPIKIEKNLVLIKKEKNKEVTNIVNSINSIVKFSINKKKLLVHFTNSFWMNILSYYTEINDKNIDSIFKFRESFIEYYKFLNEIKENCIEKEEANNYYKRDEFAFLLDKITKKYIDTDKDLSNNEIIGFMLERNPYYIEDKYSYKRECDIFDKIDLNKVDNEFIQLFKECNFEDIFIENITEYLNKMTSKIKEISSFNIIIDLINVNEISQIDNYFGLLKKKFNYIIKKKIKLLTDDKLNEAVEVVAKMAKLFFEYEKDRKFDFISGKIDKLDQKITPRIYNELMKYCDDNKYKPMKEYIFSKFLDKLDDIQRIIDLIDNLKIEKDKISFLEQLIEKYLFNKEEFYSNKENIRIQLLCELYEKKKDL